jgi:hypothetical protein
LDYALQAGNPWDMDSVTDTPDISCASSSISDGILSLQTLTGAQQPLECQTGGISDPKIQLNAPNAANTNDFRYLSFRMNTDGAWQNVPEGMIVRWVWSIQHSNGLPGHFCHLVSQDIPFDVGWHTYSIDLHDPFNGLVEEHTEGCPSGTLTWQNTSPVLQMRFDPNENITGSTMNQDIDWIRLTQMDREVKGTPFPIEYLLNKDSAELSSITFYYTTDPQNNPTQNLALDASSSPAPTPSGPYFIYQPLVFRDYREGDLPKGLIFHWDTSSVVPGIYYICAVVQDTYNQGTYCSQAPVEITSP